MKCSFLLRFVFFLYLTLQTESLSIKRHRRPIQVPLAKAKNTSSLASKRIETRRGLSIGLQLKIPSNTSTNRNHDIETLKQEILKTLGKKENVDKETEKENAVKKKLEDEKGEPMILLLKPSYQCDHWDSKTRICWLDRNIGDTVTFSLSAGDKNQLKGPDVIWKKELAQRDSSSMIEYVIDLSNSFRNIVIGRRGYEFRVSPITELDLDDNQFTASLAWNASETFSQVTFRIRIMPTDLGFVYIGETLDLSIESFIALPLESMSFHWYTEKEGEFWTLPSNMRVSSTGETLRISELRQDQEGIVACSIYTNRNVHAAKKRFLIKKPANRDLLNSFSGSNVPIHKKKDLKRHRKHFNTPIPQRQNKLIHWKKIKLPMKKTLRAYRESNQATIEDDQYTMVKPDDSGQNLNVKDTDDEYSVDGGTNSITQNRNNELYSGMRLSFSNTTDMESVVNFDLDKRTHVQEDKVAELISFCIKDIQCSNHATCMRTSLMKKGFCRCLPDYYGPGIFCREDM